MKSISRLFDILEFLPAQKKHDLLNAKENKQWKNYSTEDFIYFVNQVSYGLIHQGISVGDRVAIISNNRPEWNFVDYGCQQAGVITVPIYPTISTQDLGIILEEAEVKIIFFSSFDIYRRIMAIAHELTHTPLLVSFNAVEKTTSFSDFIDKASAVPNQDELMARKDQIQATDLFTILYTSGTTGVPKGVMLSHENILSNVQACLTLAPFKASWKALSFLPLNHIYERMVTTIYLHKNISIYYAEGIETIGENLKEIKPHIFVSVPRLIERVFDKLLGAGEKLKGWKRNLFFAAVKFALEFDPETLTLKCRLKRYFFDRLVYTKWRAALGGNVVCIASGGAALQPRLGRVFHCASIPVLEGYGLTETSPVISVNCYDEEFNRIGTVGPVIANTEVKIADDGEILVKGPGIMLGYYKKEKETAEVIDNEGWFHTGDIGTFVDKQFLKITDRKKEIFKTSSGKYIAPLMIENRLKECRFVEHCCVVGDGQKFASALIVMSTDYLKEWTAKNNIELDEIENIVDHPALKKEFSEFLNEMNKTLAPYEQIKRPELLVTHWSVEGGELTPKMSVIRKIVQTKHQDAMARIYHESE
jgi:long-chain acyl-CoA synthetase